MEYKILYLVSTMILLLEKLWRILRAHIIEKKPLPTNTEILLREINQNLGRFEKELKVLEKYIKNKT